MADLPFLDRSELLLVRTLEAATDPRAEVLARIDDLLLALPETDDSTDWNGASVAASQTGWSAEELLEQLDALVARDAAPSAPLVTLPAPMGAPGPSRWRWARVLAGVVIVAVVTAGAGAASRWSRGSATPAGATPTSSAAVAANQLTNLVTTAVPAGYLPQPGTVGGRVDLTQMISNDGGADARAALTGDGFVGGLQQLWQTDPQHQIVVSLYRFDTVPGAASYAARRVVNTRDHAGSVVDFAVAAIPGAVGLTVTGAGGAVALVVFTKGGYLAEVVVKGPSAQGLAPVAQQLATAQRRLL